MSDTKDALRNMVQNLIKDNTTQAEMDLHPVFTAKMKEIAGINNPEPSVSIETDEDETNLETEE